MENKFLKFCVYYAGVVIALAIVGAIIGLWLVPLVQEHGWLTLLEVVGAVIVLVPVLIGIVVFFKEFTIVDSNY